jgi:hypothetical protein
MEGALKTDRKRNRSEMEPIELKASLVEEREIVEDWFRLKKDFGIGGVKEEGGKGGGK